MREHADALTAKGYRADVRTVDAGTASSVAELVARVEDEFGGIDVLHYNAASLRRATIAEQPSDTFVRDLAVNIGGALAAAKAVAPKMGERGSGTILLTGGGFALAPNPDYLSLSIGKAGIRALAQGLFKPFSASGIHVATVTVQALVSPRSREAEGVAEMFWQLHSEPAGSWSAEVSYRA
jgi:NAD(P)-dependent dehydrogenase (short-subunit alcohol dehydrogenase family)